MTYTQLHRNHDGGAKRKIFLVLLVLIVAAFAGWYFFIRESSPEIAEEEPEIPCHSDDDILCTFIQSWDAPTEYRFIIEETVEGVTATSTYEYDFGEPAKIHAKLADGQETISIGNTFYTKSGDEWLRQVYGSEQTEDSSGSASGDGPAREDLKPIEPDHYQSQGAEACGTLTCYKYQVFDPENPDVRQYVWFDDQEFKLRQLRFESGSIISEQTFEYVSVNITEPSPVRDS